MRNRREAYKRLTHQANQARQGIMRFSAYPGAARKFFMAFGCMAFLAACDHTASVTPVATEPDLVTAKLGQAADKASRALDGIAGIEQQRAPASPPVEDYTGAPPNLVQPVTIRWSGPIEQISKTLADRAGMRFRVKGSIPPVPLTVSVDVYQQPLIHVLRDIGLQAGQRADLAVDAQSGVVEIRYAPADRG